MINALDRTPDNLTVEAPESKPRYWIGQAPHGCDFCGNANLYIFVDGRTTHGPWAIMCSNCFDKYGRGLGTGFGQEYTRQEDGRFIKTAG